MTIKEFKKLFKQLPPDGEILCRMYDYEGNPHNVDFDTEIIACEQFGVFDNYILIIGRDDEIVIPSL